MNLNDILTKIYSYEYFGVALCISIAVLVLLFILVLIFGKKDKRKREIEATKKLEQVNTTQINLDELVGFKDDSKSTKVEVKDDLANINDINNINNSLGKVNLEDVPQMNMEEDLTNSAEVTTPNEEVKEEPKKEDKKEEVKIESTNEISASDDLESTMNINNFNLNDIIDNTVEIKTLPIDTQKELLKVDEKKEEVIDKKIDTLENPIFAKEVEKPFVLEENSKQSSNTSTDFIVPKPKTDEPVLKFDFDELMNDAKEIKEKKEEVIPPLPEKKITKGPEIFSSVYVKNNSLEKEAEKLEELEELPKKKEENIEKDDEFDFELPALKSDTSKKEKPVDINEVKLEEEELELPTLNSFNVNDIEGESYNIRY